MTSEMKRRAGDAMNNALTGIGLAPFRDEVADALAGAALSAALDPMDATELQKIALIAERIRAEKRAERDGKGILFDLDEARVWTLALKAHALGEKP